MTIERLKEIEHTVGLIRLYFKESMLGLRLLESILPSRRVQFKMIRLKLEECMKELETI